MVGMHSISSMDRDWDGLVKSKMDSAKHTAILEDNVFHKTIFIFQNDHDSKHTAKAQISIDLIICGKT